MKRAIGAVALTAALVAGAGAAQAQEIQLRGPLAGAPACRQCVLYREGRLGATLTFGSTIQDEFDRTLFTGIQLQYHFLDNLGIGVWGAFGAAQITTGLTDQVTTLAPAPAATNSNAINDPHRQNFPSQIGQRQWIGAVQLTFIPLRGKFALFQNIFVDTDFYIFGGAAAVGVAERSPCPNDNGSDPSRTVSSTDPCWAQSQVNRQSRVAFAPTFGVGFNFYLNRFLALMVEYRAFPFSWNTSGTDEASCTSNGTCQPFPDYQFHTNAGRIDSNDRTFQFNQMVNFGITVFLPNAPHRSR